MTEARRPATAGGEEPPRRAGRERLAAWLHRAGVAAAALAVVVGVLAVARAGEGPGTAATGAASSTTSLPAALADGGTSEPAGDGDLRLVVLGDSVTASLLASLDVALDALDWVGQPLAVVRTWTAAGFGLGADRPGVAPADAVDLEIPAAADFAGWRDVFAGWVDDAGADVVLLQVGLADLASREVGGTRLAPGTPEWRTWYREQVARTADALTAGGAHLVWLVPPCAAEPIMSVLLHEVAAAVEEVAHRRGDTTVLPFDDAVCPSATFTPTLPDPATGEAVPVREADGVHLTADAAAVVAPWLADHLAPILAVAAAG